MAQAAKGVELVSVFSHVPNLTENGLWTHLIDWIVHTAIGPVSSILPYSVSQLVLLPCSLLAALRSNVSTRRVCEIIVTITFVAYGGTPTVPIPYQERLGLGA